MLNLNDILEEHRKKILEDLKSMQTKPAEPTAIPFTPGASKGEFDVMEHYKGALIQDLRKGYRQDYGWVWDGRADNDKAEFTEGVFAEPSAASTIAGLKKLIQLGEISKDENVVCVITGAGLKDPSIVERLVEDKRRIKMYVYSAEERRLTKLGKTKLQILQILSERELHGYGIWKTLKKEHLVKITVPSVYQHLSELETLNLVRKNEAHPVIGKRKRRYYTLTEKGKEALHLKP